jgi:toxin-antitoxin system PIN domain toxin
MKYLLDVNVLVAWGWEDHVEHERVASWIASVAPGNRIFTSAIPQLGFVRVSVQRTGGRVTVAEAGEILAGMLGVLGGRHAFLPDNRESTRWPDWCISAARTTDAHLLALANAHGARLATLDTNIPTAFVLPAKGSPTA